VMAIKCNGEWIFLTLSPNGDNSAVVYPRENDFYYQLNKKLSVL
jgi:hypothetical protein